MRVVYTMSESDDPVIEPARRVTEYTYIITQPDPYYFERGDTCRLVIKDADEPATGTVVDFSAEKAVVELRT